MQDGERARIGVDRHIERPIPRVVKTQSAAKPERIERIDDRSLFIHDHPHFLEIDAERRRYSAM